MPNWCNNDLEVTGDEKEIARFKYDAGNYTEKEVLSLQSLVPMPKEKEKDWYNWHVENWGTKWDVDATLYKDNTKELLYSFDSAWSPPIEAFVKASKNYPTLKFVLEYDELGMCFMGTATIENGILDDVCEDIPCGLCPECGEDTQLVRGECGVCGASIDRVITKIGKLLDKGYIERSEAPDNN